MSGKRRHDALPSEGEEPREPHVRIMPWQNMVWAWSGNVIYLASQWAILMALAKLGTPELVGQFSLGLAITAPIMIFCQMQLRQMVVTDVRNEHFYADYLRTRISLTLLGLILIGVVIVIAGYSWQMTMVIGLIGIAKAFESISDVMYGEMQRHERMDYIAISMIIKGVGSLLVFVSVLWRFQSLLWALVGMAAVWLALLVAFDLPLSSRLSNRGINSPRLDFSHIKRIALRALPLALAGGFGSLSTNVPRYFLEAFQGKEAVAMYSVAAAPLAFITLFSAAISQATMAQSANCFQRGDQAGFNSLVSKVTLLSVSVGACFTLIFLMFGEELIALLFTPHYASSAYPLVVMSAGVTIGSLASVGSMVLSADRQFYLQFANVFLGLLVQIPLCYWLIRDYGVDGASWSEFSRCLICGLFLIAFGALVVKNKTS